MFEYSAKESIPRLYLDRSKIEQIIYNILENAIQYSYTGTKIKILASYNSPARKLRIDVSNIGVELPENGRERKKIFSFGYRAKSALPQKQSGFGIGLFLSKEIAHAHGGDIYCHSKRLFEQHVSFLRIVEENDLKEFKSLCDIDWRHYFEIKKDYLSKTILEVWH